jgi:hypothetical protein
MGVVNAANACLIGLAGTGKVCLVGVFDIGKAYLSNDINVGNACLISVSIDAAQHASLVPLIPVKHASSVSLMR